MNRRTAREALNYPADRIGECDRCHAENSEIRDDLGSEGEGNWGYCYRCVQFYAGVTRKEGWLNWRVV